MFEPKDDEVLEVPGIPRPDVGAPLPSVLASEDRLFLSYIASEADPTWGDSSPKVVSIDSPDKPIVRVEFKRPYCHLFGPPNDEAFEAHPLASRGLRPYSVSEIRGSSWLRALEKMNGVHPCHEPTSFAALRHFIFAFHDSTFECVAPEFTHSFSRRPMSLEVVLIAQKLARGE